MVRRRRPFTTTVRPHGATQLLAAWLDRMLAPFRGLSPEFDRILSDEIDGSPLTATSAKVGVEGKGATTAKLNELLPLLRDALPVLSMAVHEIVRQIIAASLHGEESAPTHAPSAIAPTTAGEAGSVVREAGGTAEAGASASDARARGTVLWKAWNGHLDVLDSILSAMKAEEAAHDGRRQRALVDLRLAEVEAEKAT